MLYNGNSSYWALCHPGSEADFHARAGFVLGVMVLLAQLAGRLFCISAGQAKRNRPFDHHADVGTTMVQFTAAGRALPTGAFSLDQSPQERLQVVCRALIAFCSLSKRWP